MKIKYELTQQDVREALQSALPVPLDVRIHIIEPLPKILTVVLDTEEE